MASGQKPVKSRRNPLNGTRIPVFRGVLGPAILLLVVLAFPATPKNFKILILGDSLTEGYGVEKEDAFPALLEARLQGGARNPSEGGVRNPNEGMGKGGKDAGAGPGRTVEVINGGSSGSTSASGVRRLKWYAKTQPDLVILALGSNDGLRGVKVEETRRNVEAAIAYCQEQGWKVALTGLQVPPNYGAKYTGEFRAIFPELARKHKLPILDFLLKGVAGEAEMNQADGIHPNERGHARIADNLSNFLKPLLPALDG